MAKKYMTAPEVVVYLASEYTAKDLSLAAQISTQHAYNIVGKKIFPSIKILNDLGITAMYEVHK